MKIIVARTKRGIRETSITLSMLLQKEPPLIIL